MRTRFTYPLSFRTERAARLGGESIWNIGAVPVPVGKRWHLMIDTPRPDSVRVYLAEYLPGIVWKEEPSPEPSK